MVSLPYDFYRAERWLSRIPSISNSIRATIGLIPGAIAEIGSLTDNDVKQLAEEIAGVKKRRSKSEKIGFSDMQAKLFKLILEELNHHGGEVSFPNGGTVSAEKTDIDPIFEVKQLLNLYSYCWNMLRFVMDTLPIPIVASLPGHWQPKHYRKYPPINLVRETLRRVSIDVEIVQRAIVQRKRTFDSDGRSNITAQGKMLLIMDKLAFKSLAPFQHLLTRGELADDSPINPITYFSENTHIRSVPHSANVILVGIAYAHVSPDLSAYYEYAVLIKDWLAQWESLDVRTMFALFGMLMNPEQTYSAADVDDVLREINASTDMRFAWPSFELMTIPHEVGHFVYHHGYDAESGRSFAQLQNAFVADNRKGNAKIARFAHWHEEIFADIYGCIISGPLTAMGMQALLASGSQRSFTEDDGEHPSPIFRPYIISEILRELARHDDKLSDYNAVAKRLDQNWKKVLELRGFVSAETKKYRTRQAFPIIPHAGGKNKPQTIEQVLAAVRPIISHFVRLLNKNVKPNPWGETVDGQLNPATPWCTLGHSDLNRYDDDMQFLSSDDLARQTMPTHLVSHSNLPSAQDETDIADLVIDSDSAEKRLLAYLDNWGDKGPGGWGSHP